MPSKKRSTASTRNAATTPPKKTIKLGKPPVPEIVTAMAQATLGLETLDIQIKAATAEAPTIVYIHGIGNKPVPSVLKCQWDTALFDVQMGDRTRMAYWVNRERYPVPIAATCGSADFTETVEEGLSAVNPVLGIRALDDLSVVSGEIAMLTAKPEDQATLAKIAARMEAVDAAGATAGFVALDLEAKLLPLPEPIRRFFARQVTRLFLRDVNDFLFSKTQRDKMRASLIERIFSVKGPMIVIAHSQGTMIAYDVLRELTKQKADVRLFITMGSPLGIQEVQDFFRRETKADGRLPFPPCVDRWLNVNDRLDPVAIDATLAREFGGTITDVRVNNPDSPRHPHSATGYLSTGAVRTALRDVVGNAFGQEIAEFVVARDLVNELEDAATAERRDVLIELTDPLSGSAMAMTSAAVQAKLEQIVADRTDARIDVLKRFISAKLTRAEVEALRADFKTLRIETIWKDAEKRALIFESTNTIQCRPANNSYGATGRKIHWAVLDTGVRASHPHFKEHKNIAVQWDCTQVGPVRANPGDADDHGHGTHVSATIAGRYIVAMKESEPDAEPVTFAGMAPEAKIHDYKVLDRQGHGKDSYIIKALDHIASVNDDAGEIVIHGVNLSLGGNFDPKVFGCGHTPLCRELRRLWRQGVIVVLAAGNEGYAVLQSNTGSIQANIDLSIGDPANLDEAIAVGSVHKTNPHTYGISFFSSRGPTADGRRKPDVVAPGERIVSACHRYPDTAAFGEQLYVQMSGTSMAAPHVSGLLAAFLSLRREFIGYPDRVKEILLKNCVDLRRDPYIQGYGMPNLILMLATN